jgi:hypothetical protein
VVDKKTGRAFNYQERITVGTGNTTGSGDGGGGGSDYDSDGIPDVRDPEISDPETGKPDPSCRRC